MKALVRSKYGPPELLQLVEQERPLPRDDEVLIKIHATTVNRTDCALQRAEPFVSRFFTGILRPKKKIPGTEFAGIIEASGKDVTSFEPYDRVFGFDDSGFGSHAEYKTISEDEGVAKIPEDLSYEEAAPSTEGAHYAINFINKVELEKGQKAIVNGATGAIGSAAVQLLKYYGVEVNATCNTKNIELVKSLGASKVIDYTKEDFTRIDDKYDYVFDTVGKSSFNKCRSLLLPGGVYISSDLGLYSQNLFLPLITKITGSRKVKFPVPRDIRGSVNLIKKLTEEGRFKAVIDRIYPFEEIIEAYKYVETGEKTGNVVITMGDNKS